MTVLTEGDLQITIPDGFTARKFDGPDHRLSCMKAVDFIIEEDACYLFVEFKDPQHPDSNINAQEFEFKSEDLKYKYRDSFLYEWASGKAEKPVYYFVLVTGLKEPDLLTRTDELKRKLPCGIPSMWKREIVVDCAVFNIETWNEKLPSYPITRISS